MSEKRPSRGHMDAHPQNDWETVHYDARYDTYWVEAGGAKQALFFCPWCGKRFPPSQRDCWFDELEALGIDPGIDPIPIAFQSSAWRGVPAALAPARQTGAIEGRYIDFFDMPLDDGGDDEVR